MYNIIYTLFGIALLVSGALHLILKTKKINLIISTFLLIIFVLLVGTRPLSIPDTTPYFYFYKNLDLNLLDLKYSYFEKGFVLFAKIIKKYISNSERVYFAVITIFNLFFLEKNLKKEFKKTMIPLYIYISYYGIYHNMIILRFGLGFIFFTISVFYNKNKKLLMSLVFFIISYFYHKSFIFGIFIYLIPKRNLNRKFYLTLITIIGLLYYFRLGNNIITILIDIYLKYFPLENRYSIYLSNLSYEKGFSYRFFLNYLILIWIYLEKKIDGYFYNLYIFGMLFLSIFSGILLIERITDIYLGLNMLAISYYIENNKNKLKNILIYLVIVFFNFIFITRILKIF